MSQSKMTRAEFVQAEIEEGLGGSYPEQVKPYMLDTIKRWAEWNARAAERAGIVWAWDLEWWKGLGEPNPNPAKFAKTNSNMVVLWEVGKTNYWPWRITADGRLWCDSGDGNGWKEFRDAHPAMKELARRLVAEHQSKGQVAGSAEEATNQSSDIKILFTRLNLDAERLNQHRLEISQLQANMSDLTDADYNLTDRADQHKAVLSAMDQRMAALESEWKIQGQKYTTDIRAATRTSTDGMTRVDRQCGEILVRLADTNRRIDGLAREVRTGNRQHKFETGAGVSGGLCVHCGQPEGGSIHDQARGF